MNRDPIAEEGALNLYGLSGNNPVNLLDALGLSGTITINTADPDSSGSIAYFSGEYGHARIQFMPDGVTVGPVSYGTFGIPPQYGLRTNHELQLGYEPDCSRSKHIDDNAERRLFRLLDAYKSKGGRGWTWHHPCSSFAADAWNTATGEHLSSGCPSTPAALRRSINHPSPQDLGRTCHRMVRP
jgi:hypothetical protein